MTVVDASIVVRLLQNRQGDDIETLDQDQCRAAEELLDDFADLPLVRYPMQPHHRRALALRNNEVA